MQDLISRQAAIDALTKYWQGISDRHPTLDGEMAVYADCKGIIKRLPSAQPEQPSREYVEQLRWERDLAIQQLKDLGYGLGEKIRTNGDTISRQAAIDALDVGAELLKRVLDDADIVGVERAKYEWGLGLIESYISDMEELPSAQPEDKCGECDAWNQYKNYSRKSQWIPCNWHTKEENLPQECKSVLVCIKEKSGYLIGVSYRADYNRWEGFGRANVIAWMPLPEPYTERRTDGDSV